MSYISRLKIVLVTAGIVFLFVGFRDMYYQSQIPNNYNSILQSELPKDVIAYELEDNNFSYCINCEQHATWYLWVIMGVMFLLIDGVIIFIPIINAKKKTESINMNSTSNVSNGGTVIEDNYNVFQTETNDANNRNNSEDQSLDVSGHIMNDMQMSDLSVFDDLEKMLDYSSINGLEMRVVDEYVTTERKPKTGLRLKLND